jgi:hypothetical protein
LFPSVPKATPKIPGVVIINKRPFEQKRRREGKE